MSKQMKQLRQEIEQTLNEEKEALESFGDSVDTGQAPGMYNCEGWVEALTYALKAIDRHEGEPTLSEIQQDTLEVVSDWFDSDENEWRRLEQALRLPLTPLSWEGEEE